MGQDKTDRASWPYANLMAFGYFGWSGPGGRALVWRTLPALFVLAVAVIVVQAAASPAIRVLAAVLLVVAVAFVGWAYVLYLRGLDELSRLIQLQAFAVAYGAAMTLLFGALGFIAAFDISMPSVWPLAVVVIVAEPVRGVALALLARKYA